MPFTISHIAAVLPFNKVKNFSMTALVIGSISPDFGFYFLLRESSEVGHSLIGIALFDIPLALIMCYLYHNIFRNMLINNLPTVLRNRFSKLVFFEWNNYAKSNKLVIMYSLLLGILSHLAVDEFTHNDGFFLTLIPNLSYDITVLNLPVYSFLQITLSILGLTSVVLAIVKLPQKPSSVFFNEQRKIYWGIMLSIAFVIFVTRILFWPEYNTFWGVIMAALGSCFYSWMITSCLLYYKFSKSFTYA